MKSGHLIDRSVVPIKRGAFLALSLLAPLTVAQETGLEEINESQQVMEENLSNNSEAEQVMVTGTRITRNNFDSATPIAVYTAEELANSNVTSIDEFLMKTPEFTGNLGGSTNNGNTTGSKMVNLRGLGFKRTLILINGRRTVGSFVGGADDVGAVDLNSIPMAMVERIDVFKDGASTIYGSDAIAGVVNIVLKKEMDGFELRGGMGYGLHEWEGWDGKNANLALTFGGSNEKSSYVLGVEYTKQKELYQGDRKWGEYKLWPFWNAKTGRFETKKGGSINSRTVKKKNGELKVTNPDTGLPQDYVALTDSYNYAPVNALITPNERFQMTAIGNRELFYFAPLGTVTADGEIMFTKRTSHARLAPDASFSGFDFDGRANNFVPKSNSYNTFGEDVLVMRRFEESGGRLFDQTVDTYRFSFGLNGELDNNMHWDLHYVRADEVIINEKKFNHRFDRWATAVNPALCAQDATCKAITDENNNINPFGPFGTLTSAQIDYLMAGSLKDIYSTSVQSLTFNIGGGFNGWTYDNIMWAAGFERRLDQAKIKPDEFTSSGLTTSGAITAIDASMTVEEYYAELSIPLVSDTFIAQDLILDLSARHSNYNTSSGSTTTYATKIDWVLNDSIKSRITYATGFRAPNLVELNNQSSDNPITENYCEFIDLRNDINETAKQNCRELGYGGMHEQGTQWQANVKQEASNNVGLKPEKSATLSMGTVFTPMAIENLSMSIDYYHIKVDDYIDYPDINAMALTCLSSVGFSSPICRKFDSAPSAMDGTGIGEVTYGFTQDATVPYGNMGTVTTSGIDFALNYIWDLNYSGMTGLRTNLAGNYLLSYEKDFGELGSVDYAGKATDEDVFPHLKMNATFGVFGNNWSADWVVRYIGEAEDYLRPAAITDDAVAESVIYNDILLTFNTQDTYFFSIGIDNLFDQEPPTYHSGFTMRTSPAVYDTFGRKIWLKASMRI